ncbi:hypothetical protein BDL97_19G042000 [Sphagnum fallax]|nr:hypothetical protein BDL97_19G042000 [Sphagnum fallax]
MAMEQAKKEACDMCSLPPRKRFKLLEKERRELEESQQAKHKERKELEEQRQKNCPKEKKELDEQRTKDCQTAYPLCSEITNVVRLSPNKIISKGFKVLEKRKHKELLQQQQQQKSKWKMGQEPAAQVKEKSLGLQVNTSFMKPPQSFLSEHKDAPTRLLQIHSNKENQDIFKEEGKEERLKTSEERKCGSEQQMQKNILPGSEEPQKSDLKDVSVLEQVVLKKELSHLGFPADKAFVEPEKENVSQVEKAQGNLAAAMYNPFSTMSSVREDNQKEIMKCKSSYEESDWEEEETPPRRTFGKRSGITQRVHAPIGLLLPQKRKEVVPSMKTTEQQQEEEEEEEDGVLCDVCRSTDAEPSDPIVFCDGCDVGVHASCYGNPLRLSVPEGDWFCAQCLSHDPHSKTCCLCPSSDGAMKQTTDGSWAHISCAVFVPEVFFHSAEAREPINCSHVPSRRWKSVCSVCKSTGGACVECTETGCQSTFHISCGLKEDLAIDYRDSRSGAVVISFCKLHTPTWNQQQESKERVKFKIVSRDPKIGHKYKAQLHV